MVHRSSGSFELVLAPVLLGFLGFWIDRTLGTTPFITIVLSVVGIAGAVVKTYYEYRAGMATAARRREAARTGAGLP